MTETNFVDTRRRISEQKNANEIFKSKLMTKDSTIKNLSNTIERLQLDNDNMSRLILNFQKSNTRQLQC